MVLWRLRYEAWVRRDPARLARRGTSRNIPLGTIVKGQVNARPGPKALAEQRSYLASHDYLVNLETIAFGDS